MGKRKRQNAQSYSVFQLLALPTLAIIAFVAWDTLRGNDTFILDAFTENISTAEEQLEQQIQEQLEELFSSYVDAHKQDMTVINTYLNSDASDQMTDIWFDLSVSERRRGLSSVKQMLEIDPTFRVLAGSSGMSSTLGDIVPEVFDEEQLGLMARSPSHLTVLISDLKLGRENEEFELVAEDAPLKFGDDKASFDVPGMTATQVLGVKQQMLFRSAALSRFVLYCLSLCELFANSEDKYASSLEALEGRLEAFANNPQAAMRELQMLDEQADDGFF